MSIKSTRETINSTSKPSPLLPINFSFTFSKFQKILLSHGPARVWFSMNPIRKNIRPLRIEIKYPVYSKLFERMGLHLPAYVYKYIYIHTHTHIKVLAHSACITCLHSTLAFGLRLQAAVKSAAPRTYIYIYTTI